MDTPHDSVQLELDLFPGVPWNGRCPRVLTRGVLGLFLRPEPPRHEVFFDPEQLEFWPVNRPHRKRGRRAVPPAPSLLQSLPRRSQSGAMSFSRRLDNA